MTSPIENRSSTPVIPRGEWDFRTPRKTRWYDEKKYGHFDFLDETEVFYCTGYEFDRLTLDADVCLELRQSLPAWQKWQQTVNGSQQLSSDEKKALAKKTFDALLAHYLQTSPDKAVVANWF